MYLLSQVITRDFREFVGTSSIPPALARVPEPKASVGEKLYDMLKWVNMSRSWDSEYISRASTHYTIGENTHIYSLNEGTHVTLLPHNK